MADAKTTSEFKDLFDLAKSKKYVTYDEINELMPAQVVGAAQIDELLMKMMAEYNVELVASEKKIPISEKKSRKLDEDKPEDDEEEELAPDPEAVVTGQRPREDVPPRNGLRLPSHPRGRGRDRQKDRAG